MDFDYEDFACFCSEYLINHKNTPFRIPKGYKNSEDFNLLIEWLIANDIDPRLFCFRADKDGKLVCYLMIEIIKWEKANNYTGLALLLGHMRYEGLEFSLAENGLYRFDNSHYRGDYEKDLELLKPYGKVLGCLLRMVQEKLK